MPSIATAQDDKPTIAVHLEGQNADKYRDMILAIVPDGVEVMEKNKFTASLRRSGLTGGKMGYAITSSTMRKTVIRIVAKSVKRDKLAGAIIGRTRSGRKGIEVALMWVEEDGELAVDESVPVKSDAEANLENALGAKLEELAPAKPEPEPEPDPEPDPEPEPADDDDDDDDDEPSDFEPNRPGSELFNIYVGADFGGRFFSYTESPANTDNLRPYDVFGAPALSLAGEVYPAATLDITFLSDLGIGISYLQVFGLDSETTPPAPQVPQKFGTNWNRLTVGLRYRLRIGDKDDHPITINPDVRFGFHNFTFEAENEESRLIENEISTAEYLFIRAAIDARIPVISWFAILPAFGFIGPLEGGPVYDRFTDASVLGIDMGLNLAFVLGAGIELRGGAEYTRYFSSFKPVPGDAFVAGGALDQYLALKIGAAYVF